MIRKIILMWVLLVLSSSLVLAGTVERSFSTDPAAPGSSVDVTLTITPSAGDTKLVLTEDYPEGFMVTYAGGLNTNTAGVLKKVFSDIVDALPSYTYTVTVPADQGNYVFSGTYILVGTTTTPIVGETSLVVATPAGPTCGNSIKETGEACDGTDFGTATCSSESGAAATGSLSCTATCTIDSSGCTIAAGDPKEAFLIEMGNVYDDAQTEGSWTLPLVTRIANLLKSIFS